MVKVLGGYDEVITDSVGHQKKVCSLEDVMNIIRYPIKYQTYAIPRIGFKNLQTEPSVSL